MVGEDLVAEGGDQVPTRTKNNQSRDHGPAAALTAPGPMARPRPDDLDLPGSSIVVGF